MSKPLVFGAAVKTVPPGTLKGAFQVTVQPEGLHFKQGKKLEFLIPAGTPAEYLKANRFRIHLPDYQIELTVTLFGTYTYRLTRDLVAFMNRQSWAPAVGAHKMPWPYWVLALLPVGIPLVVKGGAIAGAFGGALVMVNYSLLQNEDWAPAVRIGAALAVSVVAYAAFIALAVSAGSARPF